MLRIYSLGQCRKNLWALKTYQTTCGWFTFYDLLQGASVSKWPFPSSRFVLTQHVKAPYQKPFTQLLSSAPSGAPEAKKVCCCLKVSSMQTVYNFVQNASSLWGIPFSIFGRKSICYATTTYVLRLIGQIIISYLVTASSCRQKTTENPVTWHYNM